MSKHELKRHKVGDLIRNDSVYGDGETGVVIDLKSQPHNEYDVLVRWGGWVANEWIRVDPKTRWYLKILARGNDNGE
jgi:hypothetical protein